MLTVHLHQKKNNFKQQWRILKYSVKKCKHKQYYLSSKSVMLNKSKEMHDEAGNEPYVIVYLGTIGTLS